MLNEQMAHVNDIENINFDFMYCVMILDIVTLIIIFI